MKKAIGTFEKFKAFRSLLVSNTIAYRSFLTMIVQGVGRLLGLFAFIVLARLVSVQDYGHIIFGNSMAKLVAAIAMMGCLGLMVKSWGWSNLSGFDRNRFIYHISNWHLYRGLPIVTIFVLAWMAYSYSYSSNHNYINQLELLAFIYVIPLFLANLYQSYLISTKRPIYSGAVLVVINGYWFVFVVWAYFFKSLLTWHLLLGLFVGTATIMIGLVGMNSKQYGIQAVKPQGSTFSFAAGQWGSMLLAQSSIIMLKYYSDSEQIAYYGVALQLSMIVSFVLGAINSNVVSQLSEDYNRETKKIFQHRVTHYTRIIAAFSIIVLLILFAFGYYICLMFGDEYGVSYYILCVLLVGQSINVFNGCNGWLLNLTGNENITAKTFYLAIGINLGLGAFLVRDYGALGVAVSSSVALVSWNFVLTYYCFKKIKINPTILPLRKMV